MDNFFWEKVFFVSSVEQMRLLSSGLARFLCVGDLVVLCGELGAGKTTFTQGLGAGIGIDSGIISPTFVLVREHENLVGSPRLVHVDAYRLGSCDDVDSLGLEDMLDTSIVVVEWGAGLVEFLSPHRLVVTIVRSLGEFGEGQGRTVSVAGFGCRWEVEPVWGDSLGG